jgi:iron complex transport system substrate-binding protein
MIRILGGIVGVPSKANALAEDFERGLETIRGSAGKLPRRPRVYFEEWDDPLISGIQWVEELIEIAGGVPVFPALRHAKLAKDRIVTSDAVIDAQPDLIIRAQRRIAARPGWDRIPAVRDGHIYEIKSTYILQPGPASLTEGVRRLQHIIEAWAMERPRL